MIDYLKILKPFKIYVDYLRNPFKIKVLTINISILYPAPIL